MAGMEAWAGIATDWNERPLRGSKADLRRSQRECLRRAETGRAAVSELTSQIDPAADILHRISARAE